MPLPVIAGAGAVAAAKHLAFQALAYIDIYTLTFTIIFTKVLWANLPSWIKEDISFRRLVRGSRADEDNGTADGTNDSRGELTHIGSIINKIQALANSSEGIEPVPQIHAALLAFIQLSGQVKYSETIQKEQRGTKNNDETHFDHESGQAHPKSILPMAEFPAPQSTSETRHEFYLRSGTVTSLMENRGIGGEKMQSKEDGTGNATLLGELQQAMEFSTWAYHEDPEILEARLSTRNFDLLDQQLVTKPGYVGYYIAISEETETIVVGIKGTSSLEDIVTDCCGRSVPISAEDDIDQLTRIEVTASTANTVVPTSDGAVEIVSGHERIWVEQLDDDGCNQIYGHEGIHVSSKRLFQNLQPIIEGQIVNRRHKIILCGHSLGASAAAMVGVLIKEKYPQLFHDDDDDDGVENDDPQLSQVKPRRSSYITVGDINKRNRVQVYAFGPPPVLDYDTAIAVSTFCVSVVHNSDIIPRCSIQNLAVFLEVLRAIQVRMDEISVNPVGPVTTTAFLKMLGKGVQGPMLLSKEELRSALSNALKMVRQRKAGNLYVPGRVLLAYHPWTVEACMDDNECRPELANDFDNSDGPQRDSTMDKNGPHAEEKKDDVGDNDAAGAPNDPQLIWIETNGACPALRVLEYDGLRMFTDHVCSTYHEILGMEYSF